MRVLVTGASGVFGREIVARLAGSGHEVIGFSRSRPILPPGVTHHAGDIRDEAAVTAAMAGCEVVAHCAWALDAMFDDPAEREINIGGTANVLSAMTQAGARRIVFASSSTAYGPRPGGGLLSESEPLRPHPDHVYGRNKQEVEELLALAPVEDVSIRATVVVGRRIDNRIRTFLAAPALVGVRGEVQRWQVVHSDDVGRLFALACGTGPTGPVNLAADDVLDGEEVAALLGRRFVRMPRRMLEATIRTLWDHEVVPVGIPDLDFLRHQPMLDTAKLTEEFGFTCAWSGREAIEDTHAALFGLTSKGADVVELPWRRPYRFELEPASTLPTDGTALSCGAANPADAGEFDTPVDPRFEVFTATNFSEALPGPATPLSLTTVAPGIQAALVAAADFVGMSGVAGGEARTRFLGIFGHRLWANVLCGAAVGELSPGWDAESITEQYLGRHSNEFDMSDPSALPIDRPSGWRAKASSNIATGVRGIGAAAGYSANVDEVASQTGRLDRLTSNLPDCADPRLEALFRLGVDVLNQGWAIAGYGAILAGAATTTAEKYAGRPGVVEHLSGAALTSSRGLAEVERLARLVEDDAIIGELLLAGSDITVEAVEVASPEFAAHFSATLEAIGHRGPAECELASRTFADDPAVLLRAVVHAVGTGPARHRHEAGQPIGIRARGVARIARHFTAERERNRDRVVKIISILRAIAREQGARLAAAGTIAEPGDAFYLTSMELFAPGPDVRVRIGRRKQEQARLAGIGFPVAFTAPWTALPSVAPLCGGATLQGVGASPGLATGPVRVVGPETVFDLAPGDILVSHVTDVGYTPVFGRVAGVITDVGGRMSHAAVVAREFGIPAVVDAADATGRLTTGMIVEIDGTAGTIRRVDA
jgi:nucleoside-diphosphate-sugar epimerase/phosphohistidine swiveling domain-containing protein